MDGVWEELLAEVTELNSEEPVLPRRQRAPRRFDEATTSHFDSTPEDMYHRHYFEVQDMLIGEIECRFESPSFTFYVKMESILVSAAVEKAVPAEGVKEIVHQFTDDLIEPDLLTELKMLKHRFADICVYLLLPLKTQLLVIAALSQTCRLLQLLLVTPATSATAEWPFSSLRHVKTYLRTPTKQDRNLYSQRQGD